MIGFPPNTHLWDRALQSSQNRKDPAEMITPHPHVYPSCKCELLYFCKLQKTYLEILYSVHSKIAIGAKLSYSVHIIKKMNSLAMKEGLRGNLSQNLFFINT